MHRNSYVVGGKHAHSDGVNAFDDDEIEFDFFADAETVEVVERRRRLPQLRRAPASRPGEGPPGLVPLARLAGLIATVIVVAVVLVSWIDACAGKSAHDEYAHYLSQVRALAQSSSQIGTGFTNELLSPALKKLALETSLQNDAAQERRVYDQAQQIRPPAPLRQIHQELLAALALRADGLAGLGELLATPAASNATHLSATIAALAAEAQLLTTSDVVWDQLYRLRVIQLLRARGITGLVVPQSHVLATPNLVGAPAFALLLQRLHGSSAQPTGTPLLKLGAAGADVAAWQTQLDRWLRKTQPSRPLLPITGTFDTATESATKALQHAAAITADGIVGPATRRALTHELAAAK